MQLTLANAIIQGQESLIRQALTHPVDLNQIDEYGYTPLVEAAIVDNHPIAELLVHAGADVNYGDITDGTPLHWAVENHNYEFCEFLLQRGANPNAYTMSGESCLVKPLLRGQHRLKNLLVDHGGSLSFANDFINTKLLGHRYELVGAVDIVDTEGKFVELDMEGFFLEFSLDIIRDSLQQFKNNFAARDLRKHFERLNIIVYALSVARELLRYQHYNCDRRQYKNRIEELLAYPFHIIPSNYDGHAVTFVKYRDFFAKCDRRKQGGFADSIQIYRIGNPSAYTLDLIDILIYEKKSEAFMQTELAQRLQLQPVSHLLMRRQISGNCSWANVESAIPVAFLFLMHNLDKEPLSVITQSHPAMELYHKWLDWDKARALHFCLDSIKSADPARKASKFSLLAAILFQRLNADNSKDVDTARRIVKVLREPKYGYILQNYLQVYAKDKKTAPGSNLARIIEIAEDPFG